METKHYFLNQPEPTFRLDAARAGTFNFDEKIVVKDNHECVFIKVRNICYVEAAGAYSKICLQDGSTILVSKNVKSICEKLPSTIFHRVHKSYLININYISRYIKKDGGYIIMENGSSIPVSVRKKDTFSQLVDLLAL